MRLGVNKARQKIEEVIEVQLRGESVYISAGEDIWIKGGAQIMAKGDIELIAGNDIHMEPGKALMEFASSGYGVTGGMGSGLAPSVGFDFQKAHGYQLHAKHNHLKAGERVIMRSKGGQYLVGTIVEAKDIEVKANKLLIESVYDRHEQSSKGLSADTSLAFGVNAGDADSQWIQKPSGFYATNRLNVAIDEDLELIGSVLIGPDGDTHIQSERFCYRHLAESESSSSLNVAASFIWDAGSIDFGSVIPGSFEVNYHTASQSGTTHATVAGSRYDPQCACSGMSGLSATAANNACPASCYIDPLDIKDLEHSDDLNQLNRNPDTVQTRSAKHSSHIRIYVPVADVVDIWKGLRLGSAVVEQSEDLSEKLESFKECIFSQEGDHPQVFGDYEIRESEVPGEGGHLVFSALRGHETGAEVSIAFVSEAVESYIDHLKHLDESTACMLIENDEKQTIDAVMVTPEGHEIWINFNPIATILAKEQGVFESKSRLYEEILKWVSFKNGFAHGFFVDGPVDFFWNSFALGKKTIEKVSNYVKDPEGHNEVIEFWVLQKYLAAKVEWASFKEEPKAYLADFYHSFNEWVIDFFDHLLALKDDPNAVGQEVFNVLLGCTPIPIKTLKTIQKVSPDLDHLIDIGHKVPDISIANPLPDNREFARVIKPEQVRDLKKGEPVNLSSFEGAEETFITRSDVLPRGMSKAELAKMLTIQEENVGGILRFKLEGSDLDGLATPYNRFNMKGFINGGKTDGGLPEYIISNRPIRELNYELEILE